VKRIRRVMHCIIADGWSPDLLVKDLSCAYTAILSGLAGEELAGK
jgi:hypothetical protein